MRWCIPLALASFFLASGGAQAQSLTYVNNSPFTANQISGQLVDPSRTFVQVTGPDDRFQNGNQTYSFIRLSDLQASLQGPTSQSLITIANRLDRLADRFREGIALAGAINVLPPNPGDRFAVSFGGAGYDGTGAGSVAVSARINESTIAYVGYARGATQNLVKGGVGFSFK